MLKTLAVALLAVGMSVGLAQAKGQKQRIPACGEGKQATTTCSCGIGLVANHCCARRANGAMAGGYVPARRRVYMHKSASR